MAYFDNIISNISLKLTGGGDPGQLWTPAPLRRKLTLFVSNEQLWIEKLGKLLAKILSLPEIAALKSLADGMQIGLFIHGPFWSQEFFRMGITG